MPHRSSACSIEEATKQSFKEKLDLGLSKVKNNKDFGQKLSQTQVWDLCIKYFWDIKQINDFIGVHDICQACGRNMMVLINWKILQDKRLLHFATCHTLWAQLDWRHFSLSTGQWPEAPNCARNIREEVVSWLFNEAVTRSQPGWAVVRTAWF